MFLDLDPPDDASIGMDAGTGSGDAGAVECSVDSECDDGSACNGEEVCNFGRCEAGPAIECDDGIGCTRDVCRDARGGCVAIPEDDACGMAVSECVARVCDPDIGCRRVLNPDACDDGIACTEDRCALAGCEHVPNDALCGADEYCEVDPTAGTAGCAPIPGCVEPSDCPELLCNEPPICEGGTCVYIPVERDDGCFVDDPCTPVSCSDGACDIRDPVTCAPDDPSSCLREQCQRTADGDVTCSPVPREGESCASTRPCHTGTCVGNTCLETNTCLPSSDPCLVNSCVAGGCASTPVTCGSNASCVASGTAASCQCDPGWMRCSGSDLGCSCAVIEDAGRPDAGSSSGTDAGMDAGRPDAGRRDAGRRDAGYDSGMSTAFDAAGPQPDGGPHLDGSPGGGGPLCLPGLADCNSDGMCECDLVRSLCIGNSCECLSPCPLDRPICCPSGFCGVPGDC